MIAAAAMLLSLATSPAPARALGEDTIPEPALQVRSKATEKSERHVPVVMPDQLYFSQQLRVASPPPGNAIRARTKLSGFRNKSIKVVRYTQPVRFRQGDYVVKFEAPGAKRTIVSIEVLFF